MPRIGVIAGLREETDCLEPVMRSQHAPVSRVSGARPRLADRAVESLIELGVDGILSYGTAGAMDPTLAAGDIIVGSEIVSPDGERWRCDPDWMSSMSSLLEVPARAVLGSPALLGADQKKQLFVRHGTVGVDMESLAAARIAHGHGVPVAVLRAVIDTADMDVPDFVMDGVRHNGTVSVLPILAGLCMQPWKIGVLSTLGQNRKAASAKLRSASRVLGPGFGLFTL